MIIVVIPGRTDCETMSERIWGIMLGSGLESVKALPEINRTMAIYLNNISSVAVAAVAAVTTFYIYCYREAIIVWGLKGLKSTIFENPCQAKEG